MHDFKYRKINGWIPCITLIPNSSLRQVTNTYIHDRSLSWLVTPNTHIPGRSLSWLATPYTQILEPRK
jgi:hypothetical protein